MKRLVQVRARHQHRLNLAAARPVPVARGRNGDVVLAKIAILIPLSAGLYASEPVVDGSSAAKAAADPATGLWYVPFAFYTDSFRLAAGMAVVAPSSGPTTSYGGGIVSANGTLVGFAGISEWMTDIHSRSSMSGFATAGWYPDQRLYASAGTVPRQQRAGTNDSSLDNHLSGSGYDYLAQITGTWTLPLLDGRDGIGERRLPPQERTRPAASSGGGFVDAEWIVFSHGQAIGSAGVRTELITTAVGVGLVLDHTDYRKDPSRGSRWRIAANADPGWLGSTDSWLLVEGQASVFVPLPMPGFPGRTVLALDAWTADTPSWREDADGTVHHRPPPLESASLGGFYRLRALPIARYNDRAAIHYSAELRLMPSWSPTFDLPLIGPLAVGWWQAVVFAEIGRVAGEWDASDLHHDLKSDVGVGVRALIQDALLRADLAIGDGTWGFKVMVGHTF